MQLSSDKFSQWFKNKNTNKTLTWLYGYGQVELQTTYTAPKKFLLITNVF